jgi:hypothetical protein
LPDAAFQIDYLFADWRWHPPVALGERLKAAVLLVFTFSFKPHYTFGDDRPLFGSLFTLSLGLLPLLPRARRLWFGAYVGAGALFAWAFTFWVDRNLQTFAPLLAAVTAAILIRAWSLGWVARVGVAALVGTQLVWGGDLYFSGSERIADALSLIKSGIDGKSKDRFHGYRRDFVALGGALPKDATVLLHNKFVMLGIDRRVLLDAEGFQGLIDYRSFTTPRDMYERLRAVGVTHVAWRGSEAGASLQADVIYHLFTAFYAGKPRKFGSLGACPHAPRAATGSSAARSAEPRP